jgi:branched-chain amino acid transport system substrate-binding protein
MLTALLQKKPDIIDVDGLSQGDQGHIIKQARELGFEGLVIHPDATMAPDIIGKISGLEALEGDIGASQLVNMPTEAGRSYRKRFTDKYGTFIFWTSYAAYEPIRLLCKAIETADSFDTKKVADALGKVTFAGMTGSTSFRASKFSKGLPRALKIKMYVTQIKDGKEVDVYSGYSTYMWGQQ